MKRLTIDQITDAVRIKYDEQSSCCDEMIVYPDDFDMNAVIMSNVAAAYRFVMLNAESSLLEGKQIKDTDSFTIDDKMVGHIPLPDDFLRGITIRLSSWDSSASDIIEENSPEYRMQSDPYACGNHQHPVVALVHTVKGKELELYKARTRQDTLRSFVYVPLLSEDAVYGTDDIQIPEQLSEPLIYYIAALTATTFREDVANDFFKVARSLLGIE